MIWTDIWREICCFTVMKLRHPPTPISAKGSQLRIAVSFSSGIRAIRYIASFLELDAICSAGSRLAEAGNVVAVVVWGRKQTSARALNYAARQNLPVWFLEDGFIRSCDPDSHSRKTYSIIVDKSGVYYDAAVPSDIESLLNRPDDEFDAYCSRQMLAESRSCREMLVGADITKYNFCPTAKSFQALPRQNEEIVLVIDQTLNDASVKFGAMTHQRFMEMLDAAIDENPGKRLIVRTHPDVVAGLRDGYLLDYARKRGVELSAEGDNPIEWLKRASHVYVGTSQLGYEALLCNCRVTTFGQPFYAGWGLTDDRNPVSRRVYSRSVDQLFYVAHMELPQYRSPINGEKWTLRQCLDHVVEQKKQFARNARSFKCVGISPWKRRYLSQYLRSPDGSVEYVSSNSLVQQHHVPLTWSYRRFETQYQSNVCRVEDGFLRSKGLGSDYVAPASLVIDMQGMYFDQHAPSDLEKMLNNDECTTEQCLRARQLRQSIVKCEISKYNVVGNTPEELLETPVPHLAQSKVLIIGQVEDDESIRRGCGDINTNSALCKAVRQRRPDDYLIYKPHPDVESGNRKGKVPDDVINECIDEVAVNLSIIEALAVCDECHTMTSLTGFEALIRDKKVFTYGIPFYAGWGLTNDELSCERRTRSRSLDELVYFALVKYPRYLHVESGEFITPEQQVRYLTENNPNASDMSNSFRWINKFSNIVSSLRYAA